MTESHGLSLPAVETIAGFSAGLVSTLAVHPLDIIKTRLQVDRHAQNRLGSSWGIARAIARKEGLLAFYRGLTPNLVGNSLGWGSYFVLYRKAQEIIYTSRGYGDSTGKNLTLSSWDYVLASSAAGALSALVINPVWVVKTRILSTSATHKGAYQSLTEGMISLLREEGIRGYFRGLIPSLVGVSHGALYFLAYEKLKKLRAEAAHRESGNLTNSEYILISAVSKVFAGTLTYPHQVVRARLQTYNNQGVQYKGVVDVIKRVWQHEGALGFYKGLGPNLIRVVPSTCVTFIVYENVRWALTKPVENHAVY